MFLSTHEREECYGCRACESICPKKCIVLEDDAEGFMYPIVDRADCIHCSLCERACPYGAKLFTEDDVTDAYYGVHDDATTLFASSSGGAFSAICGSLASEGAVIYGAAYDESLAVVHARSDTPNGWLPFRKSKYIQSNMDHVFERVASDLKSGRDVLFSGTPCQCAAIRTYLAALDVDRGNLVLVDILCHGVASQRSFDAHIRELNEASSHGEVKHYMFKNKTPFDGRVNTRTVEITYADGEREYSSAKSDMFLKGYYSRLFYRPSCYECAYARKERITDITLGDAWGIEQIDGNLSPEAGISLVFVQTDKGRSIINRLEDIGLNPLPVSWARESQEILLHPTMRHANRDSFFESLPRIGFGAAVASCTHKPFLKRIFGKIRRTLKK